MLFARNQRTIAQPVAVRGYGFWSGKPVRVEFRPAAVNSGITFVRDDLRCDATVAAKVEHRLDIPRRTNLRTRDVEVDMVEHIVAALAGLHIDNCEVGVDAVEMPGCDGSSLAFVEAIENVGIEQQHELKQQLEITEKVRIEHGSSWIEACPAVQREYRVEFQLDYPNDPVIGRQAVALDITPKTFRQELASCRTFVLEREAEAMILQGLGTHVTTQDLLVFGSYGPIENRLRFHNECARHKALDLVGDLALTGRDIVGRIVAHRSSHQLNAALARELLARFGESAPLRATA